MFFSELFTSHMNTTFCRLSEETSLLKPPRTIRVENVSTQTPRTLIFSHPSPTKAPTSHHLCFLLCCASSATQCSSWWPPDKSPTCQADLLGEWEVQTGDVAKTRFKKSESGQDCGLRTVKGWCLKSQIGTNQKHSVKHTSLMFTSCSLVVIMLHISFHLSFFSLFLCGLNW